MFCPNCGKDCGDAKFCSECGQDLRSANEVAAMDSKIPEPPVGRYESAIGYVEFGPETITVHKKVLFQTVERKILYSEIFNVAYKKATGLGLGYLAIREKKDSSIPLPTSMEAAGDETTLSFGSGESNTFYGLYLYLKYLVDPGSSLTTTDVPSYTQAKQMPENEKKTSASKPAQKLKSRYDILNEKKAALDKSGQVYCPKCLSTSVTANQKGFSFGRGAIGAAIGLDVGLIAGGIGSKKIVCTCLKCGYQWKAGKK